MNRLNSRVLGPAPITPAHANVGRVDLLKTLILAAGLALTLALPAYADPQTFGDETKATAFCKAGNVVWFNPTSKIYFPPGSQFYGKTKAGGYTCKAAAEKDGYRATKGH